MAYNDDLSEKIRLSASIVNFLVNSIGFYLIIMLILYINYHNEFYKNNSLFIAKAIFLEILLGLSSLSNVLNITRYYIKGWMTSFYWISFSINVIALITIDFLIANEENEYLVRFKRCYLFSTSIYFAELFAYLSKGTKND